MNKTPIDSSDEQVVHPHHHHKGSHRKHHHRHHRSHQNHEKKSDPTIELPKEKEKELQSSATKLPVIVREESSDILNNEENDSTNQASPPENTIAISITDGEGAKAKDTKLGSSIARNGRRVSTTEERRNPFAQREGNSLVWNDVSMSLTTKQCERKILNSVWGDVPSGEITAIMGPSGAGKTTLLNILSGRCRSNANIKIESDIRMNDYAIDPATNIDVRKQIAFVSQDDALAFTATPREAIRFSAKLRLPRITTDDEIEELADKMLEELGLGECAGTMIGGSLVKGISGGERKRTSVGVELVTKPTLVFLDEPTSGLDSFSAMQVIKVLKKIAQAGCSVLFTIHQPSSDVFNSFDRLILLNRGMVMYQGSVNDCPNFFAQHNHTMPKNYNPADWIMSVAQQYTQEQLITEGFFAENDRVLPPALVPKDGELLNSLGVSRRGDVEDDEWKHVGFGTETRVLFQREIRHNLRNKQGVGARFALTTFISILVGSIFFGVGGVESYTDPSKFNSHFGAMILEILLIAYYMVDLQAGFFKFLAIEYALAMSSTAVAVLVGCSVEDPKMAIEFMPILFIPQILFAGLFVRTDLIPVWLRWAQYLCALTYGVNLALLAEFGSCAENVSMQPNMCAQLLGANQVKEEEKPLYWAILWGLFFVFRLGGLAMLRKKATKFY
eukprot:g2424.t1 g2424   contig12:83459-85966(+)